MSEVARNVSHWKDVVVLTTTSFPRVCEFIENIYLITYLFIST